MDGAGVTHKVQSPLLTAAAKPTSLDGGTTVHLGHPDPVGSEQSFDAGISREAASEKTRSFWLPDHVDLPHPPPIMITFVFPSVVRSYNVRNLPIIITL